MSGIYTVGIGGNFPSLTNAYVELKNNGINGPITLLVISDLTGEQMLSDSVPGLSSINTITITSLSKTIHNSSGKVLVLKNVKHLFFKNITIGSDSTTIAIHFINRNEHISFYECNIYSNPNAKNDGFACIYFNNSVDSIYTLINIDFVKNKINGGFYNMVFHKPQGPLSINYDAFGITIDSNTFTNAYSKAVFSNCYARFQSISHNTISSRSYDISNNQNWTAVYLANNSYAKTMNGNCISSINPSIAYANGIIIVDSNGILEDLNKNGLSIINNKIILRSIDGSEGVVLYKVKDSVFFLHNSLFLYGNNGQNVKGLKIYNPVSTLKTTIKNNLFYIDYTYPDAGAFPIYYERDVNGSYYDTTYYTVDYNNYYTSGLYMAYAGGLINSLSDLHMATKQDVHSVNRFMSFLYPSLELNDTTGFVCPRLSYVQKDITGKQRKAITLMGVYEYLDFDVSLSVSYPTNGSSACVVDMIPVEIKLTNYGNDTLDIASRPLMLELDINTIQIRRLFNVTSGIIAPLQSLNVICNMPVVLGNINLSAKLYYQIDRVDTNDMCSVHTIIKRMYLKKDTFTVCPNQLPFYYQNRYFSEEGTFDIVYTCLNGCDSVFRLQLYIDSIYKQIDTVIFCSNKIPYYSWRGKQYFNSGLYYDSLMTVYGCDSIFVLDLLINPTFYITDTLHVCENLLPIVYADSLLTSAGTYVLNYQTMSGCDSVITLQLYTYPIYYSTDTVSVCDNDLPFRYGDSLFNVAGNYDVYFSTINGCDSVISLQLFVNPTYIHTDTLTICQSELPYIYGDSILYASGNYNIYFQTTRACDSLISLKLYVNPVYHRTDTLSICHNELPYVYGDSILFSEGHYDIHFHSTKGCDSLITLQLYVCPVYSHSDTLNICNNELPFMYGDSIFNAAGTYSVHFKTINNCDSVITLHLKVNPTFIKTDTIIICNNELPFTYGDSIFHSAGTYNIHYNTVNGCDSLKVLHLLVNPFYNQKETLYVCENDLPLSYGNYTFFSEGIYEIPYQTINGCDSLIHLYLFVDSSYHRFEDLSICKNQLPYTYGDSIFYAAGTYNIRLYKTNGCDSLITLRLFLYPDFQSFDTISICENQLPFSYGDSLLYTQGNYTINLQTIYGCDSIIKLTLFVDPVYKQFDTVTICESEFPYIYKNRIFTSKGNYDIVYYTQTGCDSIIKLTLNALSIPVAPNKIYGDTVVTSIGKYVYYIDPVENAQSYQWNISNVYWVGKSTIDIIQIDVLDLNDSYISVLSKNRCGQSHMTSLYINAKTAINELDDMSWKLEQNIPNPFSEKTSISYQIPEDGFLILTITSINGQILYAKKIYAKAGINKMEIDFHGFSNGIYFYSVEYNHERIVKKMTVQK